MQDILLSTATITAATLWVVAGLRKLAPRIDGPWLVFVAGTLVGIALSFAAAYLPGGTPIAAWALAVRGAACAAVAFGYANWRQWAFAQLPTNVIDLSGGQKP